MQTVLKKSDNELQIVWGEVYAPIDKVQVPDCQVEFMKAEEILGMAYRWMAKSETRCIDIEHKGEIVHAYVVESFIARKGDPDFVEGAWVCGVHIPDPDVWAMVKSGELNGFSMYGRATQLDAVEIEVPAELAGVTKAEKDHRHEFSVAYGPRGEFIGGVTDTVDGHYHLIKRGTVTEESAGHSHTFDFVKGARNEEATRQGA